MAIGADDDPAELLATIEVVRHVVGFTFTVVDGDTLTGEDVPVVLDPFRRRRHVSQEPTAREQEGKEQHRQPAHRDR